MEGYTSFAKEDFAHITSRFSHQISISSYQSGVGRSTCIKRLRRSLEQFPFRFISAGALMRIRGPQFGFQTIEEFARRNREHPEDGHDKWCDNAMSTLAQHNFVVGEGRLVHITMPRAYHVFLKCDLNVRAHRRSRESGIPIDTVRSKLINRDTDDCERYDPLYPGCLWPERDFDLVIDTQTRSRDEVAEFILAKHAIWVAGIDREHLITHIECSRVEMVAS